MQSEQTSWAHTSTGRAVRHHLVVIVLGVVLGAVAGWLYAGTASTSYLSTTRVLVNPSVGNPYAPTPSSVRQDELTSLETEAQVARSAEVLAAVAEKSGVTTHELERHLQVTVPPNTQILEISYSATKPQVAERVADAIASTYLENREQRFNDVNAARIQRVAARSKTVVDELRAATAAALEGPASAQSFQSELAAALRNELVSLRAQRTALENSESPPGSVIAPASTAQRARDLSALVFPAAGALVGLMLAYLLALLLERVAGAVRSTREVEETALPVFGAVPQPSWRARLSRQDVRAGAFTTTIRRLRASMLDLEPRPDIIAITPAGTGRSDAGVSEAVAESLARAGHRVVLVQTEGRPATAGGLDVGNRGLADALLHERLNALDLLQPSVEPLLCLLPAGQFTDQSRELLVADRVRELLAPLVDAGNIVVIQAPGIDTAEGEAAVGAADLGLVVVTLGRTRPQEIEQVTTQAHTRGASLGALVVGHRDATRRTRHLPESPESDSDRDESVAKVRTTTRADR